MGRHVIKIKEYYLEWLTEIDAPVTTGMHLETFKEYYQREYGRSSMEGLERRLERVEKKGTSSMLDSNLEEQVERNFAGPPKKGKDGKLKRLTLDEIYQVYCLQEPLDGWLPDWFNQEEAPSALTPEHEFLIEISRLFAQKAPPETEQEINQSLLDAGYDPEEMAEYFRNLAKSILGERDE